MTAMHSLPEAQRNRLLRRVDWRFLLPNPAPEQSICFATGLLAEAVAVISQQTLPPTASGNAACDLAVAVNPGPAVLQTAWRALRPGGACYVEWYRPPLGGARGVRRRLTQAGFDDLACYWPWPWPNSANPLFWLPLAAPAALTHFLAQRPQAASTGQRLWQACYRRLWQVVVKRELIVPICAVARKPVAQDSIERPEGVFYSESAPGLCVASGARTHRLLLTGGLRSINKVVEQLFVDQEPEPRLVVKHARVPESIPALVQEKHVLQTIHRDRAVLGAPQVLGCRQTPGGMAVSESALNGVPIWTKMNADNYRDLAWQATDWLVQLAGKVTPHPQAAWGARLVEGVLQEFAKSFGPVIDPQQVQFTRTRLQQLGDLPLICEHRDFSPWNVLVTPRGGLAVLDWESAELQGLPGLDLIYFLTYLTFFRDGAMASKRFGESYRTLLQPATPTGAVFRMCMAFYAHRLGLELDSVHLLRLLVWLIHARSEYQHFVAEAAGQPPAALLRQSLFVQLWQAEVAQWSDSG